MNLPVLVNDTIMKKYIITSVLVLAGIQAWADGSISYTNSVAGSAPAGLALSQFNASLGTLQSMTLDLSGAFTSTFTITNTGSIAYSAGSSVRRNADILLGASFADLAVDANNPNGAGNPWLSWLSSPLSVTGLSPGNTATATRTGLIDPGTAYYADTDTLALFTGAGSVLLDMDTITGYTLTLNGETAYNSSYTASETIRGIVTYNYTTPVATPEPGTLTLALCGGVGLLLVLRRKQ